MAAFVDDGQGPLVVAPSVSGFRVVDNQAIVKALPKGDKWIQHVKGDLLKFWDQETALGEPLGNFPTYRCNDGSLWDEQKPCPELKNADRSIVRLERDYTRAKSRQIFAYGVAFHLTGEEKYLGYAVAGADWLSKNALDKFGAASWFEKGKPGPENLERVSQDLAYAVSGFAFLYYLTRDTQYLTKVTTLKKHIFDTYYDPSWGLLRWVKKANEAEGNSLDQKELVSQLDQIYGYLLWTTMALPKGAQKEEWTADLHRLANAMRNQFFGETYGLYWGAITDVEHRNLSNAQGKENPHTDFGHSIKTLWLTQRVGILTGDSSLVNFAVPRMRHIIDQAYIPGTGSWGRGYRPSAKDPAVWELDPNKEWWSLAELDQASATLALVDPWFAEKLSRTYEYWFKHMVDAEHGDVWHMVRAEDNKPDLSFPKQHSWKNAFHVFEHALVSYLTTQQLHDEPARLHFAFVSPFAAQADYSTVHPYLFQGQVKETQKSAAFKAASLNRYAPVTVSFDSIR